MGCVQRLGQPQRRGDIDIVGRNYADSHAAAGSHPDANSRADAREAQEEGRGLGVRGWQLNMRIPALSP
jgi:hypothetical protein